MDITDCPLCQTQIDPAADNVPIQMLDGIRHAHRECMMRNVMGGIGHLTNHAYWCTQMHDPDGGMTPRESALAVDAWIEAHGVVAAASVDPADPEAALPGEGLSIPAGWTDDT